MKSAMFPILLTCCVMALLILGAGLHAQRRAAGFPTPPSPSDHSNAEQPRTERMRPQMDFLAMERESKELSDLSQTIPGDVELLKKGLLPKNMIDKLKKIEKLSKHLRSETTF